MRPASISRLEPHNVVGAKAGGLDEFGVAVVRAGDPVLGGRGAAAVRHVPGDQAVATQARVDVKEPRPIEQPAHRCEWPVGSR